MLARGSARSVRLARGLARSARGLMMLARRSVRSAGGSERSARGSKRGLARLARLLTRLVGLMGSAGVLVKLVRLVVLVGVLSMRLVVPVGVSARSARSVGLAGVLVGLEERAGLVTDVGGILWVVDKADQWVDWDGTQDGECWWVGDGAAKLGKLPGSSKGVDICKIEAGRAELEAMFWLVFWVVGVGMARELSVEFVGPQQPNGEMAQWGNMPKGEMAQRGKCGSTQENDQTGV